MRDKDWKRGASETRKGSWSFKKGFENDRNGIAVIEGGKSLYDEGQLESRNTTTSGMVAGGNGKSLHHCRRQFERRSE